MHDSSARLQHLDLRVSSVLMSADSVDGNEIILEITASSARSIHFLCWIYLVLTENNSISPFAAEEIVWLLNSCQGKIEDKRVQSTAVNETQSVLLLQGNTSIFCVIVKKWLLCMCVCVRVCVLALCKMPACSCWLSFCVSVWFNFSVNLVFSPLTAGVCFFQWKPLCVCVCVCDGSGTLSVWTCDKVHPRSTVSCRRIDAVFMFMIGFQALHLQCALKGDFTQFSCFYQQMQMQIDSIPGPRPKQTLIYKTGGVPL